jgi:hypothetical protein
LQHSFTTDTATAQSDNREIDELVPYLVFFRLSPGLLAPCSFLVDDGGVSRIPEDQHRTNIYDLALERIQQIRKKVLNRMLELIVENQYAADKVARGVNYDTQHSFSLSMNWKPFQAVVLRGHKYVLDIIFFIREKER